MMNKLEEAIIYATVMHQGKVRVYTGKTFILHPMEVAQILSTMTDDDDIVTAGILHDIVEDTDGTLTEIENRFGKRVAYLVDANSDHTAPATEMDADWKQRKEETLQVMQDSEDIGVKMLFLAETLANMRAFAQKYSEQGEDCWQKFPNLDPATLCWYCSRVLELTELTLNRTGAFKELIRHVNSIWPGTFDSDKARYKKYREVSVAGCQLIGSGAKGDVYRYNDEVVIKVYNQRNTYHDVEREISLSRMAFILGIPTAISFGIVSVGRRYGAMYELVDSQTISQHIADNPDQADHYAEIMAEVAHTIHSVALTEDAGVPSVKGRLRSYIESGVAHEDKALARRCTDLIDGLPDVLTLVHGDFHTGNVFVQRGEPLLIDMDRLSTGHPVAEIADLYYFYVVLGEDDPSVVEKFMGFSYETARRFFSAFLRRYLDTEDENRLQEVTEKASLLCYARMIHKIRRKGDLTEADRTVIARCLEKLAALTEKLDTLAF